MPTVADILAVPALVAGKPRVYSASDELDREVRWVHISEHHDISRLMYGSELVLTTGVAWPDVDPTGVRFVHDLADSGAAAIVVELVRRFTKMPHSMIDAARERSIPLIGLDREIRFIDITYAVHASIIDEQLASLRSVSDAKASFTRLEVEGAAPEEILDEVTRLTSRPAVLETITRQVTAYSTGDMSPPHLLAQWEARSRRAEHTASGPGSNWMTAIVEARGQRFGRVVLVADDHMPSWVQQILDRAAAALAMNRLVDSDELPPERHAHGGLLSALLHGSYPSTQWVEVRAETLGVKLRGNMLLGMVIIPHPAENTTSMNLPAAQREVERAVLKASAGSKVASLVGPAMGGAIVALISAATEQDLNKGVFSISTAVHKVFRPRRDGVRCVIGVGSPVESAAYARSSIMDGAHAAEAAPMDGGDRPFYQVADVGISGLARSLRGDHRLQAFVERTLGRLISHDLTTDSDLEGVLRSYLHAGGNKSQAAVDYGLSRPAFYNRLDALEEILRVDLSSAHSRTSLHVALLALEQIREGDS